MNKREPKLATKREITRAMKESANLWEAFTEMEVKLNSIRADLERLDEKITEEVDEDADILL